MCAHTIRDAPLPWLDKSPNRELCSPAMDRRTFLQGALAGAATFALPKGVQADERDLGPIWAQIEKHHDEAVQRLQEWIQQPSIAAPQNSTMIAEAATATARTQLSLASGWACRDRRPSRE